MAGTIRKTAYLGSHMEYGILLEELDREVFVISGNVANPHVEGESVGVSIDPAGAAIIPSPETVDAAG